VLFRTPKHTMSLFAYTDPWSDLREMQRTMDRLIGRFDVGSDVPMITDVPSGERSLVGTGAGRQVASWNPRLDVHETDKALVVHAELPGCNKEDIKLSVDQNRLILQGEKHTKQKEKGENWVRKERFEGSFYRALPLPRGVDPNKIQANYTNGVLEVTIPKTEEQLQKHMIDIKTTEGSGTSSSTGTQEKGQKK